MSEEIVLTRRTESLRQEAAEALLWMVENCHLVMAFADRIVAVDGELHGCDWDVGVLDERQRCKNIIALKKKVQ